MWQPSQLTRLLHQLSPPTLLFAAGPDGFRLLQAWQTPASSSLTPILYIHALDKIILRQILSAPAVSGGRPPCDQTPAATCTSQWCPGYGFVWKLKQGIASSSGHPTMSCVARLLPYYSYILYISLIIIWFVCVCVGYVSFWDGMKIPVSSATGHS